MKISGVAWLAERSMRRPVGTFENAGTLLLVLLSTRYRAMRPGDTCLLLTVGAACTCFRLLSTMSLCCLPDHFESSFCPIRCAAPYHGGVQADEGAKAFSSLQQKLHEQKQVTAESAIDTAELEEDMKNMDFLHDEVHHLTFCLSTIRSSSAWLT